MKINYLRRNPTTPPKKAELIAINRLEFYKNKKNWKLSQDKMKARSRSSSPKVTTISKHLNETYDMEGEWYAEQVSPHNKAFMHEEPKDAPDGVAPMELELAIPPSEEPRQHMRMEEPLPENRAEPWAGGDNAEPVWQNAQQEWCGAEAGTSAEPDICDGPCLQHQHAWAPDTQYNPFMANNTSEDLEFLTQVEFLKAIEEWLRSEGYPLSEECYKPHEPADECARFVRGAHCAPHSSELDLSVAPEECEDEGPLSELSPLQLMHAAQRQACALRRVLRESALRSQLVTQSTVAPPLPFEEYPTRDTDPLQDVVLSGSHHAMPVTHLDLSGELGALPGELGALPGELGALPGELGALPAELGALPGELGALPGELGALPGELGALSDPHETGRARGRLHQQDKVIGIGMGRPYRL